MFRWIHRKCRVLEAQLRADLAEAHARRLTAESHYNILTAKLAEKSRKTKHA